MWEAPWTWGVGGGGSLRKHPNIDPSQLARPLIQYRRPAISVRNMTPEVKSLSNMEYLMNYPFVLCGEYVNTYLASGVCCSFGFLNSVVNILALNTFTDSACELEPWRHTNGLQQIKLGLFLVHRYTSWILQGRMPSIKGVMIWTAITQLIEDNHCSMSWVALCLLPMHSAPVSVLGRHWKLQPKVTRVWGHFLLTVALCRFLLLFHYCVSRPSVMSALIDPSV